MFFKLEGVLMAKSGRDVRRLVWLVGILLLPALGLAQQRPEPYRTSFSLEEMLNKQAVVETTEGSFVIDLLPESAPNHVGLFLQGVQEGTYTGTSFHRTVARGIIQGGDPITKDLARLDEYGRGGLGLVEAEPNDEQHIPGTVSAVVVPGDSSSGGTQFLICVVAQPGLDGHHTIWGRVSEGLPVVTRISELPVDTQGRVAERVEIISVVVRDWQAPPPLSFSVESIQELANYRAILETDEGTITVEFFPDRAPGHVRNFLRLADAGVYDGMAFHRIVRGFVVQTGFLPSRLSPLTEEQRILVRTLEPEFSDTPHVRGIVSMARGVDEASASTSFFIVTDEAPALNETYTVFARVVEGMDVVDRIERMPTDGETPVNRVGLADIRLERSPVSLGSRE